MIHTEEGIQFESIEGKSILDSALDNGYVFEYSCRNGRCGVCETTLIEGKVIELNPQIGLDKEDVESNKILSCCCEADGDVLIDAEDLSALHGIEVRSYPAKINKISRLSDNIVEVTLRLPPTAQFSFLEGQFIDVVGPNMIRRSYSIASNSKCAEIKLLIKKVKSGVLSKYWFCEAKPEDLLRIEGPKGTFFIRNLDKELVFLATGTGIAPIMSMLDELESKEINKEVYLVWGNRSPDNFVWEPKYKNLQVQFFPVISQEVKNWSGFNGYVQDVAVSELSINWKNASVYACGSNKMIHSAKKLLASSGLDEKQYFSDAFVQSY